MARGTEEQEQTAIGPEFPYKDSMTHPAWVVIAKALQELESNSDLELQTPSRYVIGYLLQALEKKSLLTSGNHARSERNGKKVAVRYTARQAAKAKH